MNNFIFILSTIVLTTAVSNALVIDEAISPQAEGEVSSTTSEQFENSKINNFNLSYKLVNFNYNEGDLITKKGPMTGISVNFFHRLSPSSILRVNAEYLKGELNYSGQSNIGTTDHSKDNFNVLGMSAVWVKTSEITESFVTSPFIGLGYRNTVDGKDDYYDYRSETTHNYLILGSQFEVINKKSLLVLLVAEFDLLLIGSAKTQLSDINPNLPNFNLKQNSGNATKIGVESFFDLFGKNKFSAGVSYKVWRINDSEKETFKFENENYYIIKRASNTTLTEATIGYLF